MDLQTEIQVLERHHLGELNELISVFEDVFEMESLKRPGESHLQQLLAKHNFYAVIATIENKIVGGLTVYVLDQYFSERPLAYIYDLAVLKDYQRKGVGRKLIEFTTDFFKRKGFEGAFVQAEKVDDYAVDFYRLTKPTEEMEVVHFYYKLTR